MSACPQCGHEPMDIRRLIFEYRNAASPDAQGWWSEIDKRLKVLENYEFMYRDLSE